MNKTFDFCRYEKLADHVKKQTKMQVLRFYDKYIGLNAPFRQKLCVHVVAKQHEGKENAPAVETQEETTKKKDIAIKPSKVVRIEDPVEFRRSMPLFAIPTMPRVEVVDLGITTSTGEEKDTAGSEN